MKKSLKIKMWLIVLLIIFAILYSGVYKSQKPANLSGYFLDVFNISNGEVHEIPSNITEGEIMTMGYEIVPINNTVLENYPTLKNALMKDGKHIDLTDEEAILIIKNFRGKVIEYNKNYYEVAVGQY